MLKLLGEGGMGAVWLAERTDGMLQRPVALKLPRGVFSRPDLVARLAREREILASLNHPNIAKVYDAGLTARGQPFLALELVEGQRLDEHARASRADLPTRLQLFLQVARAVAYAHSRLVVHRDIKPSNILVTADGSVRLLDFGVAKLLDDGRVTETEITRFSGRILTLAYAAVPEGPRAETRRILPLVELGLGRLELGDLAKAEETFEKALALMETNHSKSSPSRADTLVGLARVHLKRREPARALPLLEEAEAYWRELTPECRSAAEAAYWLGRSLEQLGRTAEAREAFARATRISRLGSVARPTS